MNKDKLVALAQTLMIAKTWYAIELLTEDLSDKDKIQLWEQLDKPNRARIEMLKEFKNSPVSKKFPIGSKVRRKDAEKDAEDVSAIGTVIGWFLVGSFVYVRFFVEFLEDAINTKGKKANSQYDFAYWQNLEIIEDWRWNDSPKIA